MKGVVKSINPEAEFVDLSHTVRPGNIKEAAFILSKSYKFFPKDSIFVIVVDPQVGSKRKILCLQKERQIFVAPDNGVLSWLIDVNCRIYSVSEEAFFLKPVSNTFHGRDIFSPVAAFLSRKLPITFLGKKIKKIKEIPKPKIKIHKGFIEGEFITKDSFGNLITSIEEKHLKNRKIKRIRVGKFTIEKLSESFEEAKNKKLGAIIDSFGNLEIFSYLSDASQKIRGWEKEKVIVELV